MLGKGHVETAVEEGKVKSVKRDQMLSGVRENSPFVSHLHLPCPPGGV